MSSGVAQSSTPIGKAGGYAALSLVAALVSILLTAVLVAPVWAADARQATAGYDFNIPAQNRLDALARFSALTGISLIRPGDDVIKGQAPAVVGHMSARQALARLLEGSGLKVVSQTNGSLVLQGDQGGQSALADNQVLQLAPVEVRADRHDWVYQSPRAVSEISKEQIERLPVRHAAELLEEIPGVASAVNRQNPGLSINIRGMQDFGRVNMMVDGMRQDFVQNGHQQRNGEMYIDSDILSGATIERGPRSNVYGAGAIAGQVNFHTLEADDLIKPDKSFGGRLRATGGLGGEANGQHFIGSSAFAGKADGWEVVFAHAKRSSGDYDIGKHNSHGLDKSWTSTGYDGNYGMVKFAGQTQHSDLFKLKYNFSDEESLKFTFINTKLRYSNTSDAEGSLADNGTPWQQYGDAMVSADNYALDYRLKPQDSNWVDIKAKLYYVHTRNSSVTDVRNGSGALSPGALGTGYSEDHLKMQTYGLQLDNTSSWEFGQESVFSANYGVDYYMDRATSETLIDGVGTEPGGVNPKGKRQMGSFFTNFTVEDSLFTLSAGLRYDRYWLKGDTQVPGARLQSRFESFMGYSCDPANPQRYLSFECGQAQRFGESWLINNYDSYLTSSWYDPAVVGTTQDYRVNVNAGRFSPTLTFALRPLNWLETYVSWGKSWRPPSINETLMYGNHPGDSFATMYPNPWAKPERTRSWEGGFNFRFSNVFKDDDRLFTKLDYFNTHVDNYLFSSLGVALPNQPNGPLTHMAYLNNKAEMHFSGVELESHYDGDWIYGGLSFTHYLGGQNDFCRQLWPYGRTLSDGSAGAGRVDCGNSAYNSSIAKPVDKGTINLGVRLFDHRLDTGLRYNYSGRGSYDQSSGSTDVWYAYRTLDWYGSLLVTENLKLLASIENMTNQAYRDGYSDAFARTWAPGRTTTVGMEVDF